MKVPVNYIVNKVFENLDSEGNKTSRQILEMLSANGEEVDVSVSLLVHMSGTKEMYKFAGELLQKYATKEEIEEFLDYHEQFMKIDCPEILQELKFHLFTENKLGV